MTLLSSTQGRPGAAVDFVVAVDVCWLRRRLAVVSRERCVVGKGR
jgi:hypothetical protein